MKAQRKIGWETGHSSLIDDQRVKKILNRKRLDYGRQLESYAVVEYLKETAYRHVYDATGKTGFFIAAVRADIHSRRSASGVDR